MNRRQRRKKERAIKKSKSKTSEFEQKLGLFDLMPEDCMICHKNFDKTNKEMVQSWSVVVREKERIVRVYCPECWTKAKNLVQELKDRQDEKQNR